MPAAIAMTALVAHAMFLLLVSLLVRPVGVYLMRVFNGERTALDRALRPVERTIYRLCGVDPGSEMTWAEYARAFVLFAAAGTIVLVVLLRVQTLLPFAPNVALATPMTADLAANTAVSFATTTTWQAYSGETTMTYLSQLLGLAAQNFLAGAAGLAVGIAFIRGLARSESQTIGNFWVDVVRAMLWVLLPLSIVAGLVLVWQGVPMSVSAYPLVATLEGGAQTLATGPVAALESIKQIGTNGGGFFNVNGAHPLENPTALANMIELLGIAVLPAALTHTFGGMVGRVRDGWILYALMAVVFSGSVAIGQWSEDAGTPALALATGSHAVNMEGKEVRFGTSGSVLAAAVTSGGATGSYNAMHDSFTPIGGAMPLVNMLLGEIAFGGLGTGIVSIILIALLGLFITGLMIGRTPEYLGKPIGPVEVKLIMLYTLIAPAAVLLPTALAVVLPSGLAGLTTNSGTHGFSEIFFAYASAFGNNGQNFAGLNANSPFYNVTTGVSMMLGRFALVIPALALAGRFARARCRERTGAIPTDAPLFGGIVLATALIVGALTYLPALALGPIAEQMQMVAP